MISLDRNSSSQATLLTGPAASIEEMVVPEQAARNLSEGRSEGTRPRVLQSLDAWRGFACLAVVCFHIALQRKVAGGGMEGAGLVSGILVYGYLGVQIFFVISGYCIAGAAVNTLRRGKGAGEFLPARGWRILPPYWISLGLIFLMKFTAFALIARGLVGGSHAPEVHSSSPAFYFVNFSLTSLIFDQPLASRVAWSLCYEAAFYLIVGTVLVFARKTSLFLWALHLLTFSSLLLLILLGGRVGYPFDLWPQFGLGVIAFDLLNNGRCRRVMVGIVGVFSAMALFLLCRDIPWPIGDTSSRTTYLAASAFFLVLVAGAPFDGLVPRFPPLRWAGDLGRISYSLYLIHFPLITAVALLLPARVGIGSWLGILVPFLLLASWLFFLVAERPFCGGFRRKKVLAQPK